MNTLDDKMEAPEPPTCEWPNDKTGPRFRNCCDADGCLDQRLMDCAAKKRIEQITILLKNPHRLTNREQSALDKERRRFKRLTRTDSNKAVTFAFKGRSGQQFKTAIPVLDLKKLRAQGVDLKKQAKEVDEK